MKDILTDIVSHTHSLGIIPLVKITGTEAETMIESMAVDRSVIINAKTNSPVAEFNGTFGMPNLDKLNLHLRNPEYKELSLDLNYKHRHITRKVCSKLKLTIVI